MPIATCFLKNKSINPEELQQLVNEWAALIQVDQKDICVNAVTGFQQAGQNYELMINLYLPSLWSEKDVGKIQTSLLELFCQYLNLNVSEVFIMTSIIQSGHVVENGEIVRW
jgi:hypothetical protein